MSPVYAIKSSGPATDPDPCGTLQTSGNVAEVSDDVVTVCVRPVRSDVNYSRALPVIPNLNDNTSSMVPRLTVSKAALKSSNTRADT